MDHQSHDATFKKTSAHHEDDRRFQVEGMHCASCASGLQGALDHLDGVDSAVVDFLSGVAVVHGSESDESILAAIDGRGLSGESVEHDADPFEARSRLEASQARSERLWRRRAIIGLSVWIPMETLHWSLHGGEHAWLPWLLLVGSTAVMVLVGGGFLSSAFRAALRRATNMDTLIAIGASTAWGWSLAVFLMQTFDPSPSEYWLTQPLYFAESAALLGIISLGHWFEAKATANAGSAVRDLLELQPDEAERLDEDGSVTTIPSLDVRKDDVLNVRPGGRIPVDGIVVDGESDVDESLLTGESEPVFRAVGDGVVAGTTNTNGRLKIRSTVSGRHTTVARIATLVQNAQASKAPIQRLADVVSSIFVPTVLAIALATILIWGFGVGDWATGVSSTVTVLIISCPCALGLATPMAVMVGAGAASQRGILIKDAASLERAGKIRHVIFDKTGTLTHGRPLFSSIELKSGGLMTEDEVLVLAAIAEGPSEHPLAKAIVDEAVNRGLSLAEPQEFQAIPGQGVRATIDGTTVEVLRDEAAACRVLVDGDDVAKIFVDEAPRADAAAAIERLQGMGLTVQMLTGDRRASAERIGALIGLSNDQIIAEATPESKLETVANAGGDVAMVGDGINDAAALARADLGIAMASGTGAAIESASIVVPEDRVVAVAEAVDVARRTLKTIRQNLFLAFLYNSLAIPIAAFGMLGPLGPLFAAAAMGLSDVSVIGNAVRLRAKLKRL